MPHHKSAAKRVITNEKSRRRNIAGRTRMRTALKAVLEARTQAEAGPLYRKAVSVLDRTAARGMIKRETASRRKSRLALFTQKLPA
jgi:small subunit ribosomal protein S20